MEMGAGLCVEVIVYVAGLKALLHKKCGCGKEATLFQVEKGFPRAIVVHRLNAQMGSGAYQELDWLEGIRLAIVHLMQLVDNIVEKGLVRFALSQRLIQHLIHKKPHSHLHTVAAVTVAIRGRTHLLDELQLLLRAVVHRHVKMAQRLQQVLLGTSLGGTYTFYYIGAESQIASEDLGDNAGLTILGGV